MKDLAPFTTASRKQFYVPVAVNHILLAANAMRKSNLDFSSPERKAGLLLLAIEEVLVHGPRELPRLQDAVDLLAKSMTSTDAT